MGKRGADHQLTKDEAERELEGSEAPLNHHHNGSHAPHVADPEVLAKRKIIRLARDANGRVDITKKPTVVNPFASIQLVPDATQASSRTATAPAGTSSNEATAAANQTEVEPPKTPSSAGKRRKESSNEEDEAGTGVANPKTDEGTAPSTTSATEPTSTKEPSNTTDSSAVTSGFGSTSSGGFGSAYKGFAEAFSGKSSGFSTGFGSATTATTGAAPSFSFGSFGNHSSGSGTSFVFGAAATEGSRSSPMGDTAVTAASNTASNFPTEYQLVSGEENDTVLFCFRSASKRWVVTSTKDTTAEETTATVLAVPPSTQLQTASTPETAGSTETTNPASPAVTTEASSQANGKWCDIGKGPLKLLQDKEHPSTLRLVQRRETTPNGPATVTILTLRIYQDTRLIKASEKHVKLLQPIPVLPTPDCDKTLGPSLSYIFKFGNAAEATECYDMLLAEITNHAKKSTAKDEDGEKQSETDSQQE